MKVRTVAALLLVISTFVCALVPASVGRIIGVLGLGGTAAAIFLDLAFGWSQEAEEDFEDFRGDVMGD